MTLKTRECPPFPIIEAKTQVKVNVSLKKPTVTNVYFFIFCFRC